MTDDALFNRLNAVTGRFDELVTRLNAGEGTAGQLLKDKQLYENMNGDGHRVAEACWRRFSRIRKST